MRDPLVKVMTYLRQIEKAETLELAQQDARLAIGVIERDEAKKPEAFRNSALNNDNF